MGDEGKASEFGRVYLRNNKGISYSWYWGNKGKNPGLGAGGGAGLGRDFREHETKTQKGLKAVSGWKKG